MTRFSELTRQPGSLVVIDTQGDHREGVKTGHNNRAVAAPKTTHRVLVWLGTPAGNPCALLLVVETATNACESIRNQLKK
jgi:hypothetical protein